ncbi:hypothetical protein HOC01_01785 [archaeon]|jgi:hypothetical protein|nr:hypothetical protein [archaeon]MBT6697949.1 hypothetical protein [archaeon]
MDVPEFFGQSYFTPRISSGRFATVYSLGDRLAAKVPHVLVAPWKHHDEWMHDAEHGLAHEYAVMRQMYSLNLAVPRPEGIYSIRVRTVNTLGGLLFGHRISLVMEKVRGTSIGMLSGWERSNAMSLAQEALREARHKGFTPPENYDLEKEVIYCGDSRADERQVVLTDLHEWEIENTSFTDSGLRQYGNVVYLRRQE